MSARVPICDRKSLEGTHTGSLLARLTLLRECDEAFGLSDRVGNEAEPDPSVTGFIEFKNTSEWVAAYRDVKVALAAREHLPKAAEREARRKPRR